MPTTFGAGKRSAAVATNVLLPLMPFFPWSPPWFATLLSMGCNATSSPPRLCANTRPTVMPKWAQLGTTHGPARIKSRFACTSFFNQSHTPIPAGASSLVQVHAARAASQARVTLSYYLHRVPVAAVPIQTLYIPLSPRARGLCR